MLLDRGDWADAASAYIGAIRGWPQTAWAPDAVVDLARALVAWKKPPTPARPWPNWPALSQGARAVASRPPPTRAPGEVRLTTACRTDLTAAAVAAVQAHSTRRWSRGAERPLAVAFSGGGDSLALLLLAARPGPTRAAAGCSP